MVIKQSLSRWSNTNKSKNVINKLYLKSNHKRHHIRVSQKRQINLVAMAPQNPIQFSLSKHLLQTTSIKPPLCQSIRSAGAKSVSRTKAISDWLGTASTRSGLSFQLPSRMAWPCIRDRLFATKCLPRMPGSGKRRSPSFSTGPSRRRTGRWRCS